MCFSLLVSHFAFYRPFAHYKTISYVQLFSGHAEQYAAARPRYPAELFEWIAGVAPSRSIAWDCATGNGQAALGLAEWFERVIATDASDAQLSHATPHPRISYRQAPADASGLESESVDALTVAQALHWLDLSAFFEEARRVLKPRGVFAAWTYGLARVTPAIDALVDRLYRVTLDGYWADRRLLVEEGYASIAIPFDEIAAPAIAMREEWTLEQFSAFLRTWSAVQRFIADRKRDPIDQLTYELRPLWGEPHERRSVFWQLAVRAGRK